MARPKFPQLIRQTELELHRTLTDVISVDGIVRPYVRSFASIAAHYPHLVLKPVGRVRFACAGNLSDDPLTAGITVLADSVDIIIFNTRYWNEFTPVQRHLVTVHELFHYVTRTDMHRKKDGCLMSTTVHGALINPKKSVKQLIIEEFAYLDNGGKYLRY